MKTQLIFKISKTEVIVEAQAGKHEPSEIGRLVNYRYPDTMLDCIKVFYQHHRDWLLDGEEEANFKTKTQTVPKTKQRIKFKDWEAIGNSSRGRIYKEVVNRILEEYKDGIEPSFKTFSNVIREMYGDYLVESSIISYAGVYKAYIRENKLAIEPPPAKEVKTNNLHIEEPIVKTTQKKHKLKSKALLPIDKVVEIWDSLPDEFEYKQVKALVPVSTMQSTKRIDAANFLIKTFLEVSEFGCEETSPGIFKKNV